MAEKVIGVQPEPQNLAIGHAADAIAARRQARETAACLGFGSSEGEEIALVVSELATNLIKHAGGGKLTLTGIRTTERVGLQIESRDQGPGMASVNQALADGFSTVGSMGTGLGTVNRLMDELEIKSRPGHGTQIVSRKWIRPRRPAPSCCPLAFGVATRPKLEPNGDDFVIKQWADRALVGVIDGCGHGQWAHRAARAARHYVETHYDGAMLDIFAGVERACRGTRGVVMALARFDWAAGNLEFASVGNIAVRVLRGEGAYSFMIRRGIIGVNAPRPVPTLHPWASGNILVLHSDGVSTHWDSCGIRVQLGKPADALAGELLRAFGKLEDDATVLVVCGRDE